jgi:hypothetical protein
MHASSILRRCLAPVLDPMHGARRKRLLTAVDALASGRRLSLTALARSWLLQVVGNMAEVARATGATSRQTIGAFANERFYNVLHR